MTTKRFQNKKETVIPIRCEGNACKYLILEDIGEVFDTELYAANFSEKKIEVTVFRGNNCDKKTVTNVFPGRITRVDSERPLGRCYPITAKIIN